MTAAWRRAQRRRSSARVMRVVATDRTIVAARIAAMVHGGKCVGTAAGGGRGGTGAKEGVGREGVAHAVGARPMAAARQAGSPPGPVSVLGTRRGCAAAGWRFIVWPFGCLGGCCSGWPVCVVCTDTAARDGRNCLGIGLDNGLERGWFWW
jgi:hypothetical protein